VQCATDLRSRLKSSSTLLFDTDVKCHFEEDDELEFEASKTNPEDWSECIEFDSEFQEKFDKNH
jgi:hypothetical protein